MRFTEESVDELLGSWSRLRRSPVREPGLVSVQGILAFELEPQGLPRIDDAYQVRIDVRVDRDDEVPLVFELDGRIPKDVDEHVNPDGDFCLGSPLAVRLKLGRLPSLSHFVDQCVVPFLYAASWRRKGGVGWPFNELPHYSPGLLEDYQRLLHVSTPVSTKLALAALCVRPRVANKLPCPCNCGLRLGKCSYRQHLASLRTFATRPYFRRIAEDFDSRKFCITSDDQTDPQADIPDLSPDALDRIRAVNRHLEADFHSTSSVLPGV